MRLSEGWKLSDDDILSKLSDNYLMHDEMGDFGGFQPMHLTAEYCYTRNIDVSTQLTQSLAKTSKTYYLNI